MYLDKQLYEEGRQEVTTTLAFLLRMPMPVSYTHLELSCFLTRQPGFLRYKRFLFGTKLFG